MSSYTVTTSLGSFLSVLNIGGNSMVGSKKKKKFSVVGRWTTCEQFSHMNWMGLTSLAPILGLATYHCCGLVLMWVSFGISRPFYSPTQSPLLSGK